MFSAEIKKFNKATKGAWILLIVILVEIALSLLLGRLGLPVGDQWGAYYMDNLSGPLTKAKSEFLFEENDYLDKVNQDMANIQGKLFSGEINTEEFKTKIDNFDSLRERKEAFRKVWIKYNYIFEDPETRFFIKGQPYLFFARPHFLFTLSAILLLVHYLSLDEEDGVRDSLRIYVQSSHKYVSCQLVIVYAFVTIGLILLHLFEFFTFVRLFGRETLTYPTASLGPGLAGADSFTIGRAWLFLVLSRLLAFALIMSILLLALTLGRSGKFALTVTLLTIIFSFILHFSLKKPIVTSLSKLLIGGPSLNNWPDSVIIGLLLLSLLFLLMLCIRQHAYRNYLRPVKTVRPNKSNQTEKSVRTENFKQFFLILFLCMSLMLSACTEEVNKPKVTVLPIGVEMLDKLVAQNPQYLFYIDANAVRRVEKSSGEDTLFYTPLFTQEITDIRELAVDENFLYLFVTGSSHDQILRINLANKSMERLAQVDLGKFIFQDLWSIASAEESSQSFLNTLFVVHDKAYTLMTNNQNSLDGEVQALENSLANQEIFRARNIIARQGINLYYQNKYFELCVRDMITGEDQVLYDFPMETLALDEQSIIFSDARGLWLLDRESGQKDLLEEGVRCNNLTLCPSYILYRDRAMQTTVLSRVNWRPLAKLDPDLGYFVGLTGENRVLLRAALAATDKGQNTYWQLLSIEDLIELY